METISNSKPDDWQISFDESSQAYYKYNPYTNESYWMNPNELHSSNSNINFVFQENRDSNYNGTNQVIIHNDRKVKEERNDEEEEENEESEREYDDDSSVSSWNSELEEDFQLLLKTKEGQSIYREELQNFEKVLEQIQKRRNFWSVSSWFEPFQGVEFFKNVKLNKLLEEQDSTLHNTNRLIEDRNYSSSDNSDSEDDEGNKISSKNTLENSTHENERLIKRQKKERLLENQWNKAAEETKLLRSIFPRKKRRKKSGKEKQKMIFRVDQGYNSLFPDNYDDDSYYNQDQENDDIDTEREFSSEDDDASDSSEDDEEAENDEEESLGALILEVSFLLCKVAVNNSLKAGSKIATIIGLQNPTKKPGGKYIESKYKKKTK